MLSDTLQPRVLQLRRLMSNRWISSHIGLLLYKVVVGLPDTIRRLGARCNHRDNTLGSGDMLYDGGGVGDVARPHPADRGAVSHQG